MGHKHDFEFWTGYTADMKRVKHLDVPVYIIKYLCVYSIYKMTSCGKFYNLVLIFNAQENNIILFVSCISTKS